MSVSDKRERESIPWEPNRAELICLGKAEEKELYNKTHGIDSSKPKVSERVPSTGVSARQGQC